MASTSFLSTINQSSLVTHSSIFQQIDAKGNPLESYAANIVPRNHSKMSVGQIAHSAQKYLQNYSRTEQSELKDFLTQLKGKVDQKRSCCFLKRIFITFLSAIYNYYQGFGFFDSATLVNRSLAQLQKQLNKITLTFEGQIPFDTDQQKLLLQIFSTENRLKLQRRNSNISINGQEVRVKYYGLNIPVFELDLFPEIIFKFSSSLNDRIRARYETIVEAREICRENHLDQLIVPDSSLIDLSSLCILAERKYSFKSGPVAQQIEYANQEHYLGAIVIQLTLLICKLKGQFADLKWDNIPLIGNIPNLQAVLIDLEPHENRGIKDALVGWGKHEGWGHQIPGLMGCCPRYAEQIYFTAKEQLPADEFEKIRVELEEGKAKAEEINQRRESIEAFHQQLGITAETPTIPIDLADSPEIDDSKREIFRSVIEVINLVIAKRGETQTNLVHAREWRLTMDDHSVDSHHDSTISDNFFTIIRDFIPFLLKAGVIHSVLSAEEAKHWDIDYRRGMGQYDRLIQF